MQTFFFITVCLCISSNYSVFVKGFPHNKNKGLLKEYKNDFYPFVDPPLYHERLGTSEKHDNERHLENDVHLNLTLNSKAEILIESSGNNESRLSSKIFSNSSSHSALISTVQTMNSTQIFKTQSRTATNENESLETLHSTAIASPPHTPARQRSKIEIPSLLPSVIPKEIPIKQSLPPISNLSISPSIYESMLPTLSSNITKSTSLVLSSFSSNPTLLHTLVPSTFNTAAPSLNSSHGPSALAKKTSIPTILISNSDHPSFSPKNVPGTKLSIYPSLSPSFIEPTEGPKIVVSSMSVPPTNSRYFNNRSRPHIDTPKSVNSMHPSSMPSRLLSDISNKSNGELERPIKVNIAGIESISPSSNKTNISSPIKSLSTKLDGQNHTMGIMFEIKTLNDVEIMSLDIHTRATSEINYEVYTKKGTKSEGGLLSSWNKVGSSTIIGKGDSNITTLPLNQFQPFFIPSGDIQAFYTTLRTPDLRFGIASESFATVTTNRDIIIFEGAVVDQYFEIEKAVPCLWNGAIRYKTTFPPKNLNLVHSTFLFGFILNYPSSVQFILNVKPSVEQFILSTITSSKVQKELDVQNFFLDHSISISKVNAVPVAVDDSIDQCSSSLNVSSLKCGAVNVHIKVSHDTRTNFDETREVLHQFIPVIVEDIDYEAQNFAPQNVTFQIMISSMYVNNTIFEGKEFVFYENALLETLRESFSVGLHPLEVIDATVTDHDLIKQESENEDQWYTLNLNFSINTRIYVAQTDMNIENLIVNSLITDSVALVDRLKMHDHFKFVDTINAIPFREGNIPEGNEIDKKPKYDKKLGVSFALMIVLVLVIAIVLVLVRASVSGKLKKTKYERAVSTLSGDEQIISSRDMIDEKNEDSSYRTGEPSLESGSDGGDSKVPDSAEDMEKSSTKSFWKKNKQSTQTAGSDSPQAERQGSFVLERDTSLTKSNRSNSSRSSDISREDSADEVVWRDDIEMHDLT